MTTPYYVIDKQVLDEYWMMLYRSLSEAWPNFEIGYSFKTNSLPWLVRYVKDRGALAEVVSHDEYLLARYMGYTDDKIIYNGPYKKKESVEHVLMGDGIVNIDSMRETVWLDELSERYPDRKWKVGVRVNFDLEKCCPGETTMGRESGRFGLCYETGQFAMAIRRIGEMNNVRVSGLHLHSSTKSRSVNVFSQIARMACQLKQEYGLNLDYVDIGGGFCGGMEGRPEYPDYFPAIAEEMRSIFDPKETKIIVEPGISLISKCTTFVSSVYDVKEIRGVRYLMTDGSRFNLDPTMIKKTYLYHTKYVNLEKRNQIDRQVVSGFSCMEVDRLFEIRSGAELKPGDQIIYENVGGYTMSLNPLFIQYFPPVYVRDRDRLTMVRRKWTPEDYVAGSEEIER